MPLYKYRCEQCGKEIELLQRIGATQAGSPCPACGSTGLVKQLSRTAPAVMKDAAGCAPCGLAGEKKHQCTGGCCCH